MTVLSPRRQPTKFTNYLQSSAGFTMRQIRNMTEVTVDESFRAQSNLITHLSVSTHICIFTLRKLVEYLNLDLLGYF